VDSVFKTVLIVIILGLAVALFAAMAGNLAGMSVDARSAAQQFFSLDYERWTQDIPFYTPGIMVVTLLDPILGVGVFSDYMIVLGNGVFLVIIALFVWKFVRKLIAW